MVGFPLVAHGALGGTLANIANASAALRGHRSETAWLVMGYYHATENLAVGTWFLAHAISVRVNYPRDDTSWRVPVALGIPTLAFGVATLATTILAHTRRNGPPRPPPVAPTAFLDAAGNLAPGLALNLTAF